MLDHGYETGGGGYRDAAPTLVRLVTSRAKAREGEALSLEARVETAHRTVSAPTGTVAFRAGHRVLGTAPLDAAGRAVLSGVVLPTGVHALVASFGGDAVHAAASSTPVPQAVAARAEEVLVAVAAPTRTNRGWVLEAELLHPLGGRLVEGATGSLVFFLDDVPLGSAPLEAGQASFVLGHDVPPGRFTVQFGGDDEYAPSEGAYVARAVAR